MKAQQLNELITTGNITEIKRVLENDKDLSSIYSGSLVSDNDVSLHPLCHTKSAEIVELLLSNGADDLPHVDTPVLCGMIEAFRLGKCSVVAIEHYLLNSDWSDNLNSEWDGNNGRFPIHSAAEINDVSLINCLIHHGADLSIASNDGETALGIAASCGHADVVKALIKSGAPNIVEDYYFVTDFEDEDIPEIEDPKSATNDPKILGIIAEG